MEQPLISVVIPVYKVGKYIENSIKSVCNQKLKDFEVLLVDNNSPDDSIEIAEKLLIDNNMNYRIVVQKKQGLPAARNLGIAEARGKWIVSIDPDDTISCVFLQELYQCAESNHLDFVFSKYQGATIDTLFEFKEEHEENRIVLYERDDILMELLTRRNPLMVSNMLFRKEAFVNGGYKFDEDVILGADLIQLWLILIEQKRIAFINKPLYNHFERPDSLMTAPSWEKLKTNREGYKRACMIIAENYSEQFSNWVSARSLFAELRVVSIYGEKKFFKRFYKEYYGKSEHKVLQSFPDNKVRLLDLLLFYTPSLYYYINKWLKR